MKPFLFALALALASGTAKAASHPMIGTWVGYMANEPEDIVVELTFTHIDDAGLASGMLCHVWQYLGTTYVWDLGIGRGTATTPEMLDRHRVRFTFSFNDTTYTLYRVSSATLGLSLERKGKVERIRLKRADPARAPCVSRMKTLAAPGAGR